MFRFRPHRVNLDSPGVAKVLGDCEADILRALWNVPNGSVQDVRAALLAAGRRISFNATMTILNRLVCKGLLAKHKEKREKKVVFVYSATADAATFRARVSREVFRQFFTDAALFSATGFVQALNALTPQEREEVRRLLRLRR